MNDTITRYPRPKGLTHLALSYSKGQIKRKQFIETIIQLFQSNHLLYLYPKAQTKGTLNQGTQEKGTLNLKSTQNKKKNKQSTTSLQDKSKENQYISQGGIELRNMEVQELAIFIQVPLTKVQNYLISTIIKSGRGLIEKVTISEQITATRGWLADLKIKSLTKALNLSNWESELLHVTRAKNYPAGLVKEVTSAMSLGHTMNKDFLNLLSHELQALEAAQNQGNLGYPTHPNSGPIPIDSHQGPVHQNGQLLTPDRALKLLEESGMSGTQAMDLEAMQREYLTDPNIPNVVANQSDAQGVLKATINLNPPEAVDHENRREATEGFEVISGTEPE